LFKKVWVFLIVVYNQKLFKKNQNPKKVMGRIKLQLIKRTTRNLMKKYKEDFKENFEENKKLVEKFTNISNNKLRNRIAGYITKLMKKKEEE